MVRANKYHKYECPCLSVIMEDSIGTVVLHSSHLLYIPRCKHFVIFFFIRHMHHNPYSFPSYSHHWAGNNTQTQEIPGREARAK